MRPAIVSGRVVGPDGRGVAGASVYFVHAPVALPDIAQRTGPDGRFSLGVPVAGRYRIGVNAPGWPAREQDVEVGGLTSPLVDIYLDAP
ncbi:carboxypeptidase-like regulatory domain-containing protein [Pyxidicoccus xibeiensis]|uniref:carboxypeptidase-like regulatory domain-containing protein n=1 Tax=Pyxidicoccus xibeiensis TaxID=2906759 RepID=UPI0020A7DE2B|nr:carboxypeptidase-like regulatory domain-containing protein [Pyxidicoccus xibeiensis]MCP3139790.1 carboxypeptidase-like regulatory domain-containing protein [Pyxidicoccus xibeiensis]